MTNEQIEKIIRLIHIYDTNRKNANNKNNCETLNNPDTVDSSSKDLDTIKRIIGNSNVELIRIYLKMQDELNEIHRPNNINNNEYARKLRNTILLKKVISNILEYINENEICIKRN